MSGIGPYQLLANAIIQQAVKDYNTALKGHDVDGMNSDDVIIECKTFFHSEYFYILTELNPDIIIEKYVKERKSNESQTYTSNAQPHQNHCGNRKYLL